MSRELLRRRLLFAGLNGVLLLALLTLLLEPIVAHFSEGNEQVLENAAQLAEFRRVMDEAAKLAQTGLRNGDPYLPGSEERVASADLQANLQSLASARGLTVLAVRGLPGRQAAQWRAIPVGLEVEGPATALREAVAAIEGQTPFLFVTDFSMRTLADGDDTRVRASLTVEGALGGAGSAPGPLLSENRSNAGAAAAER